MAIGAFGVAITFGRAGMEMITMLSILLYSASFMFSWGPICWVLISEIFPNTIRGAAVAIAVASHVQYAPQRRRRLWTLVYLRTLCNDMRSGSYFRLETGTGNQR